MFFPEQIKNIKDGDRVLEIGPGSSPFPRADVLLERRYSSDEEYRLQCGDEGAQNIDSRTVYYDGEKFPFEDGEFDYVICSHVLEHVVDIQSFCSEIFRVGRAGYFEYPLYYYEYIYDFPAHLSVLKKFGNELVYLPKTAILNVEDAPVREFWRASLSSGHTSTVRELIPHLMEGFEWTEPFQVRPATEVRELLHNCYKIDEPVIGRDGVRYYLRGMINAIVHRIRMAFWQS